MKRIYWRPSKVPRVILVVIAIVAIAGMASVELFKIEKKQSFHREKIQAARLMKNGMELIRQNRVQRFGPIDNEVDPADSGMIGLPDSLITSTFGSLPVKQTTANPNWAAVLVGLLKEAGVRKGDAVAAGFSGSFPALNLATLAACAALKLKAVPISSVAASTWGGQSPRAHVA